MSDLFSSYPHDEKHMAHYIEWHKQYSENIRESDRLIIQMLAMTGNNKSILDIGCSTGNLLRHIKKAFRSELTGGDLSETQLEACRADPELQGIAFEKMDILDLPKERYDVIIANAILYGFDRENFAKALRSIHASLKPEGTLIAFDFFHSYNHDIEIIERTKTFPNGHPLNFRPIEPTRRLLESIGFGKTAFQPFMLPRSIKLNAPWGSVASRTVWTDTETLLFRGVLFQPWCHMSAVKS
jgi:cyclopropane fatty-acyl-phospholipid synthase-like methyltransferase